VPYIPDLIPPDERARYVKGNMGARGGFGARPAVLVVDMTRTFTEDRFPMGSSKAGGPCTQAIRRLIDVARPLGLPVIYSRYDPFATDAEWGRWLDKGSGAEPDSPLRTREAHEIVDLIEPQAGDVVVTKSKPSAFFGTQLASLLTYFKADSNRDGHGHVRLRPRDGGRRFLVQLSRRGSHRVRGRSQRRLAPDEPVRHGHEIRRRAAPR
jgi:maleamate amidohydrolase